MDAAQLRASEKKFYPKISYRKVDKYATNRAS
jgi:hypothetical protein